MNAPIEAVSLDPQTPEPKRGRNKSVLWIVLLIVLLVSGVLGMVRPWELAVEDDPPEPVVLETLPAIHVAVLPTPVPQATPTPEPFQWDLDSEPQGARVLVNGQFVGSTPVSPVMQRAGSYTSLLQKAGYLSTSLVWETGTAVVRTDLVALSPEFGSVWIKEVPPESEILMNGQLIDIPEEGVLSLPTVPHTFVLRLPGHHDSTVELVPHTDFVRELRFVSKPVATPTPVFDATRPEALGITMRKIPLPEGVFQIGSPKGEQGRTSNENRRGVRFSREFILAASEVSNGQFRKFDPAHTSGSYKGAGLNADEQPVGSVTWQQAAGFCNWLSAERGLPPAYVEVGGVLQLQRPVSIGYRLPTEAEWELAARSGESVNRYPWGATFPPTGKAGNLADQDASRLFVDVLKGYRDGFAVTAPGPVSAPNRFGISDLCGNLAEWVGDLYEPRIGDQPVVVDFAGKEKGTDLHVIKGSSFQSSTISELRCARREYGKNARLDVGFRVCRYLR